MNTPGQTRPLGAAALLFCAAAAFASLASVAHAEGRHGERERVDPHWQFDSRFHHDRYYPSRGYVVNVLPAGSISIGFGREAFFFQAGVWFRPVGARFVVIDPPVGIVVPALPLGCATVQVGAQLYCYANGTYYLPAPGGYAVAPQPNTVVPSPPIPVSMPQVAPVHPVANSMIIYPRNGQNAATAEKDRVECNQWAATNPGANDPAVFSRATAACLDGRGYSAR